MIQIVYRSTAGEDDRERDLIEISLDELKVKVEVQTFAIQTSQETFQLV